MDSDNSYITSVAYASSNDVDVIVLEAFDEYDVNCVLTMSKGEADLLYKLGLATEIGTHKVEEEPNDQDILSQQLEFLNKLQEHQPSRPLKYQYQIGAEHWKTLEEEVPSSRFEVYTSLQLELVFDTDALTWEENRELADKLTTYMAMEGIPYYIVWTGGKGMHIHVLMSTLPVSQELFDDVQEYQIDVLKEIRTLMANKLLVASGIGLNNPHIDRRKIDFSSKNNGSMVKMVGGINKNTGNTVTVLPKISTERPQDGQYPLKFPNIREWNIGPYKQEVLDHIQKVIELYKKRAETPLVPIGDVENLPCYKLMMNGVHAGARHNAALSMSLMLKDAGVSQNAAASTIKSLVAKMEDTSISVENEVLNTLDSVYRDDKLHFSCRGLSANVGEQYCDWRNCPRKQRVVVDLENIIWPSGGKKPIDANTFTPNAAVGMRIISVQAMANGATKVTVNLSLAAHYIMDYIVFARIRKGADESLYYYDNGTYHSNADVIIRQAAERLLGEQSSISRKNEIVDKIKDRLSIVESDDGNREGWICVKNGYLNVFTSELENFHSGRIFTTGINTAYVPGQDCPNYNKFMSQVADNEDDIVALQQALGYTLMPGYLYHYFFMLAGEGANGKSVWAKVMERLLGEINISRVSFQKLSDNRFAVAEICDRMANICGDMSSKNVNDTEIIKQATSDETMYAERKGKDPFNFKNRAKIFVLCNKVAYMEEDGGIDRRALVFLFPHKFSGENRDPYIEQKLTTDEELSGILNYALEGLKLLMAEKGFRGRGNEEREKSRFRAMQDSVSVFLDKLVEEDYGNEGGFSRWSEEDKIPAARTDKEELYKYYKDWCARPTNSLVPVGPSIFAKGVQRKFKDVRSGRMSSGDRKTCWIGIRYDGDM